jgi:hypothetical protein
MTVLQEIALRIKLRRKAYLMDIKALDEEKRQLRQSFLAEDKQDKAKLEEARGERASRIEAGKAEREAKSKAWEAKREQSEERNIKKAQEYLLRVAARRAARVEKLVA